MDRAFLPFITVNDRTDLKGISSRLLDGFGAYRTAGHKHAGIDIRGEFSEPVNSIGVGVVQAVYGKFPYTTVLIRHLLPNGETVYSAYTHVEDVLVCAGQLVDQDTQVGRLFSQNECRAAGFYENHLHLEIRKTLERYKGISITCFSRGELKVHFYDPMAFLEETLSGRGSSAGAEDRP